MTSDFKKPERHDKGWGYEEWIANNEKYCGKLLFLKKHKKCSVHYHKLKDETFYLQSGKLKVLLADSFDDYKSDKVKEILMRPADSLHIWPGRVHRMSALEDSELFEFSTQHFEEDSIRIVKGDSIGGEIVVCTSGYFDPLHKGHLEYLELAKNLGDKLVVIVNNDEQTKFKKGYNFMDEKERMHIVKNIKCVDDVFLSIDKDKSVCESLRHLKPNVFAKGGDRFAYEIPEAKVCRELGIQIIDGLGEKVQSSSKLIETANSFIKKNEIENPQIRASYNQNSHEIRAE